MKLKRIWVLLSVLLLACNISFALNRGNIRSQIRYFICDTSTISTQQRWTDSILNQRINLAQYDICAKTFCLQSRAKIDTVTGTREYILPDDFYTIIRAAFEISTSAGDFERLGWVSIRKLDLDGSWEDDSNGKPLEYYIRRNRIGLVPAPSSSYSGSQTLQIDYAEIPDEMNSDTDIPFNGRKRLYPYHELIVWRVVADCMCDDRQMNMADYYEKKYMTKLGMMKNELNIIPDKQGSFKPRVR